MALNDNRGVQLTEADKAYQKALDAWKEKKPTFMNKDSWKGFDNVGAAINSWRAEKPKKSDFTSTSTPSTPAPTPTPTPTPSKTGESTRQTTTPATKEEGKINNDLKSVNQRGVASFVRSLLPSKDRLSPTQKMAKAGKSKGAILRRRMGKR